jgi:hypothetical protein
LIHPGVEPSRSDRLYDNLDRIIRTLKRRGYVFKRMP